MRNSVRSLADVNLNNVQKSLTQRRSWLSDFWSRHKIHDVVTSALSDGAVLIFTRWESKRLSQNQDSYCIPQVNSLQLFLRKSPTQLFHFCFKLKYINLPAYSGLSFQKTQGTCLWAVICCRHELLFDILLATQKGNRANNVLKLNGTLA